MNFEIDPIVLLALIKYDRKKIGFWLKKKEMIFLVSGYRQINLSIAFFLLLILKNPNRINLYDLMW